MNHRSSRLAALVLTVALAACSGGGGEEPATATLGTRPESETVPTTEAVDVSEITVESVQQTMDTLDESYGDMMRRLRDEGARTLVIDEWMALLFSGEALEDAYIAVDSTVEADFQNLRGDLEGPDTDVKGLTTVTPECVFFPSRRSYEPVIRRVIDETETHGYLALRHVGGSRIDPTGRILPPWTIIVEARTATGEAPADRCA